jgi:hypothetical protein
MKNLALIISLIAVSLGFSSCCSMFGISKQSAGQYTETRMVRTCGFETVTEQIFVGSSAKGGGGSYQTVETRVPRYKEVTKTVKIPCPKCVRFYCPKKDCCGTTSESTIRMTSVQGSSGSPHVGLVPTMKVIAP